MAQQTDSLGTWEPLSPVQVGRLFAGFAQPWWIAGGWAIDLYLGHETRHHEDIDVEIPRGAQFELAALLPGWDLQLAADGRLAPWNAESPIPDPVNGLWCRSRPDGPWELQVMLALVEDDVLLYRRDPAVRRRLVDTIRRSSDGLPYLSPEVQLLYKSRRPRDKDELDLEAVLNELDGGMRDWLVEALDITDPGHRWIERIQRG